MCRSVAALVSNVALDYYHCRVCYSTFMYLSGSNIGLFRKKNVKAATPDEEDVITEDILPLTTRKKLIKLQHWAIIAWLYG